MFKVMVQGGFSALHRLRLPDGTWEPLHGHDWHVEAECAARALDPAGMVVDFEALETRLCETLATLNYTHLNEHPDLAAHPTAEAVAAWIFHELKASGLTSLRAVRVREAPGCTAEYSEAEP